MVKMLGSSSLLNDFFGRILGGESRYLKSALVLLLVAIGLLLTGIWQVPQYLNDRVSAFFHKDPHPQIDTH